jgi:BASS family bile acid:Na+ symporter
MTTPLERLANAFPLWVAAACGLALVEPRLFAWFHDRLIVVGLGLIMLGMGMTLTLADFARVASRPVAVVAGFVAQFTIMPAAAWAIARAFDLPTPFAVGLILVGCCPGGTASNVVTYIARADVALSVTMTTCSTLAAVALTPLLTQVYAGTLVEVDTLGLLVSTLQVVVLPVAAGVLLNRFAPAVVERVLPVAPLASVLVIALVCGSIIGQNAAAVRESGPRLLAAIMLVHSIGFALGYGFARASGLPVVAARTIAIETGMQNSGLGVVLARKHFAAEPLTAVPGAISALVHSVLGSLLAGWWRLAVTTAERTPADGMLDSPTATRYCTSVQTTNPGRGRAAAARTARPSHGHDQPGTHGPDGARFTGPPERRAVAGPRRRPRGRRERFCRGRLAAAGGWPAAGQSRRVARRR